MKNSADSAINILGQNKIMGHRDDLLVGDLVEVLLHVQRNRRFIRVGHLDFHTAPELGLVGELTDSLYVKGCVLCMAAEQITMLS